MPQRVHQGYLRLGRAILSAFRRYFETGRPPGPVVEERGEWHLENRRSGAERRADG